MRRRKLPPIVTKLSESENQTVWRVELPPNGSGFRSTYRATTYPNSDLVFVETWVKKLKSSNKKVVEVMRAHLAGGDRPGEV
ncbi:hypothetical protein Bcep1808_7341 (plasmid) [Burkholderia vietnamiensis G4]|uniref:Uncharacterized protein n=1 Tax=Burkholderia vietnamiensis (strain G4 / LMG 22486) TaxID=269482 RepID=A4JVB5_BURVG|nr:hypothetical protein Bcep1808_7341 [Burkholderia vietnamiensis G4]